MGIALIVVEVDTSCGTDMSLGLIRLVLILRVEVGELTVGLGRDDTGLVMLLPRDLWFNVLPLPGVGGVAIFCAATLAARSL